MLARQDIGDLALQAFAQRHAHFRAHGGAEDQRGVGLEHAGELPYGGRADIAGVIGVEGIARAGRGRRDNLSGLSGRRRPVAARAAAGPMRRRGAGYGPRIAG